MTVTLLPECVWQVIERGMCEGSAYMVTRCHYCHYETAFVDALFTAEVDGRCILGGETQWESIVPANLNDAEDALGLLS